MHRTLHPGSVTDQSVRLHSCRPYVLSDSLLPVPYAVRPVGKGIGYYLFRACTKIRVRDCFLSVLTGFGFFFPAAFEILERNLLVLTGPKEHIDNSNNSNNSNSIKTSEVASVVSVEGKNSTGLCPTEFDSRRLPLFPTDEYW